MVGAAAALALGVSGAACGPGAGEELELEQQAGLAFNGLAMNGLAFNGLAFNGLAMNGLAMNGLAMNGLAFNGLAMNGFADWFNDADGGDIPMHAMTMKYVIGCALSPGRTASFTDKNDTTHSWSGNLGLADSWDENALTDEQKQWVSACLMAHVNTASGGPKNIQISVRGSAASLAASATERQVLSTPDGAFFGDLFASPNKLYICSSPADPPGSNYENTLLREWGRQCYFDSTGNCAGFARVDCSQACTPSTTGDGYASCTVDGVSYKPVSVFVPATKFARYFSLSGSGVRFETCASCSDTYAIKGLAGSSYARASVWPAANANVLLDVRYANGATSRKGPLATYLRVRVNGAYVMNGGSANWSFANTGGWDTWQTRTIPVYLPAGATVDLVGPSTGTSPAVDVVSVRIP